MPEAMSTAVAGGEYAPAHVRRTVVLCFLAALCEGINLQAAGVAAAGVRLQFHPDSQLLSYFFSSNTLGLLLGASIGGRMADQVGRKAVLAWSVALFGFFTLITAWAWNMELLIALRLLAGLGLGASLPNLVALGAEGATPRKRNANVTIIYSGMPLGGALASLVTMIITPAQWGWIFIVGGVTSLAIAPVISRWLPESQAFQALQTAGPRSGGATGIATILGEGRAARTLLLWASFFLALLTLYLLLNWLPTLLVSGGLTKTQAAASMVAFNLGGCIGAVYIGLYLDGPNRRQAILAAFIGLPLLLLLLAQGLQGPVLMAVMVFVVGIAVLAAQAILYAYAPLSYPTRIRGAGVGFAVAIGRFGSMAGPLLGGLLVSGGGSPSHVLYGVFPVMLVGSVCAIVLTWRAQPVQED